MREPRHNALGLHHDQRSGTTATGCPPGGPSRTMSEADATAGTAADKAGLADDGAV